MSTMSLADRVRGAGWRCLPTHALSRWLGGVWRVPLPRPLRAPTLSLFARAVGIDTGEAELPLREYRSVHDLFVRRLRPEARPVALAPDAICCPADGRVVDSGLAETGTLVAAKGLPFTLHELLADDEAARELAGGPYLTIYLSPRDYHRVHAPASGRVKAWVHVPGRLHSVAAASLRREPRLFARNERLVTLVDSDCAGPFACVMVAAFGVGDISVRYASDDDSLHAHVGRGPVRAKRFALPPDVRKGEELGIFHLGSTVIVVFAPNRVDLQPLHVGTQVRVGQPIGRVIGGRPDAVEGPQS